MPSGEYWPSDNVQPGVGSVVDVLYYVYGKKAYFRGTVRGVRDVEQGLALRIAFKRQTHYKLAFPAEVVTCLLYTSPSPRDLSTSRMPSSA